MRLRKFTILTTLFLFSLPLLGQLSKGGKLQFGAAGLALQTMESPSPETNNTSFDLDIGYSLLYLISDHWAVGGGLGSFTSGELNDNRSGIIPAVRYYFNPKASSVNWFANTGMAFILEVGSQTRLSVDQWILGAGLNHFLNENVALEGNLNLTFFNDGNSLLSHPEYSLGAGLLVYLTKEDRANKKSVEPAVAKGSSMIGINNMSLSYRPVEENFSFSVALDPNWGYFLTNNWLAGVNLRFTYSDFRFNSDFPDLLLDYSITNLGAGIFTRYYLGQAENRLRPFGHVEGGWRQSRSVYNQLPADQATGTDSWLSTRFGIGANLFIAPQVALEGSLTFSSDREPLFNAQQTLSQQRIGLDLGFQFFIK